MVAEAKEDSADQETQAAGDEVVQLAPQHPLPELSDDLGDDRPPPDYGLILLLQDQVEGHYLGSGSGQYRKYSRFCSLRTGIDAEHTGNGWTGEVGIHNPGAADARVRVQLFDPDGVQFHSSEVVIPDGGHFLQEWGDEVINAWLRTTT